MDTIVLNSLQSKLGFLGKDLIETMVKNSDVKHFTKGTQILSEGQYVNVVPILTDGLLKVFTRQEDKELLLYYVQSYESCIMSFMAGMRDEKSKVFAECVEDSTLLLLKMDRLKVWVNEQPRLNLLFYNLFDQRYTELLSTINLLLYDRLDKRILEFLKQRVSVFGKNPVKISHRELANELGSAREVVSRLLKKLEADQKIKQHTEGIEVI
ncbi:MAG TPA: Crp/Fnr family transcriptional regulator [Bacteroidia bacterium]